MSCNGCYLNLHTRNKVVPQLEGKVLLVGLNSHHADDLTGIPFTGLKELSQSKCWSCSNMNNCFGYFFTGKASKDYNITCVGYYETTPAGKEIDDKQSSFNTPGQYLNRLLSSVGVYRYELSITYAVKCKTPGVRVPTIPEIDACNMFLKDEIRNLEPRLIIALGDLAGYSILGKMPDKYGKISDSLYVTYDPAAIISLNAKRIQAFLEKNPKVDIYTEQIKQRTNHIKETLSYVNI